MQYLEGDVSVEVLVTCFADLSKGARAEDPSQHIAIRKHRHSSECSLRAVKGLGLWGEIERGRPRVAGVAVERDSSGRLRGTLVLQHLSDSNDDLALQLHALSLDLASKLSVLKPDAIVVRTMDYPGVRAKQGIVQLRSNIEGVLLAVGRGECSVVKALRGKDIAAVCGGTKMDIDAQAAKELVAAAPEASAAAMAALTLTGPD
jgi:hypothetical protein